MADAYDTPDSGSDAESVEVDSPQRPISHAIKPAVEPNPDDYSLPTHEDLKKIATTFEFHQSEFGRFIRTQLLNTRSSKTYNELARIGNPNGIDHSALCLCLGALVYAEILKVTVPNDANGDNVIYAATDWAFQNHKASISACKFGQQREDVQDVLLDPAANNIDAFCYVVLLRWNINTRQSDNIISILQNLLDAVHNNKLLVFLLKECNHARQAHTITTHQAFLPGAFAHPTADMLVVYSALEAIQLQMDPVKFRNYVLSCAQTALQSPNANRMRDFHDMCAALFDKATADAAIIGLIDSVGVANVLMDATQQTMLILLAELVTPSTFRQYYQTMVQAIDKSDANCINIHLIKGALNAVLPTTLVFLLYTYNNLKRNFDYTTLDNLFSGTPRYYSPYVMKFLTQADVDDINATCARHSKKNPGTFTTPFINIIEPRDPLPAERDAEYQKYLESFAQTQNIKLFGDVTLQKIMRLQGLPMKSLQYYFVDQALAVSLSQKIYITPENLNSVIARLLQTNDNDKLSLADDILTRVVLYQKVKYTDTTDKQDTIIDVLAVLDPSVVKMLKDTQNGPLIKHMPRLQFAVSATRQQQTVKSSYGQIAGKQPSMYERPTYQPTNSGLSGRGF